MCVENQDRPELRPACDDALKWMTTAHRVTSDMMGPDLMMLAFIGQQAEFTDNKNQL